MIDVMKQAHLILGGAMGFESAREQVAYCRRQIRDASIRGDEGAGAAYSYAALCIRQFGDAPQAYDALGCAIKIWEGTDA